MSRWLPSLLLGILVSGWCGGAAAEAPLPPSKDPDRQFKVARAYATGTDIEQSWEKAVYWYRRAAEQGHTRAQLQLGLAYQKGLGVEKDEAAAVEWFRAAAEGGRHAKAMYELGVAYRDGRGVEADPVTAMMWFNLSSGKGGLVSRLVGPNHARRLEKTQREEARKLADEWRAKYDPESLEKKETGEGEAAGTEAAPAAEEPSPEAAPADPPPA